MVEGEFPKIDGNIAYASEVNAGIFDRHGSTHSFGSVWINNSGAEVIAANVNRYGVLIMNYQSGINFYVGESGLTASGGYPVTYTKSVFLKDTGEVYGTIRGTGSADIRYLEVEK